MARQLSILIPTFNDTCDTLVENVLEQAASIDDLKYEILVADDGSTDEAVIQVNKKTGTLPGCRYLRREKNRGRAAIRNFLAQEAQYDTLLFIDSDMSIVRDNFLLSYITAHERHPHSIVYGGYIVTGNKKELDSNLRYKYEKNAEARHSAEKRRAHPYQDFHTSNFLIPKEIMLRHPLDERFKSYGYEDVFFGKQLEKASIEIVHVDNPAGFCTFEDNRHFLRKTEEGLRTLYTFRNELEGYSTLIRIAKRIENMHLTWLLRRIHLCIQDIERHNLEGKKPSLSFFKCYKLGFYIDLNINKNNNT